MEDRAKSSRAGHRSWQVMENAPRSARLPPLVAPSSRHPLTVKSRDANPLEAQWGHSGREASGSLRGPQRARVDGLRDYGLREG